MHDLTHDVGREKGEEEEGTCSVREKITTLRADTSPFYENWTFIEATVDFFPQLLYHGTGKIPQICIWVLQRRIQKFSVLAWVMQFTNVTH